MAITPQEDYGAKVSKPGKSAASKNRKDLGFTSAVATYLQTKVITTVATSNPHIVPHGMGYIPKIIIYKVNSTHNRKLPYEDASNAFDFAITAEHVEIRGALGLSGTFKLYIFGQQLF